jgi:hypothetical protein
MTANRRAAAELARLFAVMHKPSLAGYPFSRFSNLSRSEAAIYRPERLELPVSAQQARLRPQ